MQHVEEILVEKFDTINNKINKNEINIHKLFNNDNKNDEQN